MTHTDKVVLDKFIEQEDKLTSILATKLGKLGLKLDSPVETIHLAMDIIQSFSHEFVFDKHDYIDYNKMREIVINTLIDLFKDKKGL